MIEEEVQNLQKKKLELEISKMNRWVWRQGDFYIKLIPLAITIIGVSVTAYSGFFSTKREKLELDIAKYEGKRAQLRITNDSLITLNDSLMNVNSTLTDSIKSDRELFYSLMNEIKTNEINLFRLVKERSKLRESKDSASEMAQFFFRNYQSSTGRAFREMDSMWTANDRQSMWQAIYYQELLNQHDILKSEIRSTDIDTIHFFYVYNNKLISFYKNESRRLNRQFYIDSLEQVNGKLVRLIKK